MEIFDLEFEYNEESKNKKILKTCINMMIYRNLLDKENYKNYIKEIINNINDDETFIKLNNNNNLRVKLLYTKKNISKISEQPL
jgi:predicted lactoylglutathione lyase